MRWIAAAAKDAATATLEKRLWDAADQLRANSGLTSAQYSQPVLGLIFLRFADAKFAARRADLEKSASGRRGPRLDDPAAYHAKGVLFLPNGARFADILNYPEKSLGRVIDDAMRAIERDNPQLAGVLPKTYHTFNARLLGELLHIFSGVPVDLQGGSFEKIYEYFLGTFAKSQSSMGGVFHTPTSIARLLVEILEPFRGRILDPACGAGSMFVQSARFAEEHKKNGRADGLAIHGVEINEDTGRLCRQNLAVHGIEGDIRHGGESNSYYDDPHDLVERFDFVLADPPFNVRKVDKDRVQAAICAARRLPLGLPKSDNANYLWIQIFYSALNAKGRAGFVMASSASDARRSEMELRKQLIEARAVDVMVSVGPNMFYSMKMPCTLWFLDRGKAHTKRKDQVLFLDARNIYRQLDRAHRDWTEAQMGFLANVVRLYRGEDVDLTHGGEEAGAKLREVFGEKPKYADVPDFCKVASIKEIEGQGWSLNPERYVSEPRPDRPIDLTHIFDISGIALTDVRGFRQLDLDIVLREGAREKEGQWTILLGDNGVGKTTILRALALALAPTDVAPLVLSRTGPVSPSVRSGADTAVIQVGISGEEQVTVLDIVPAQGGERIKRAWYANVPMPFLVAYGSRRGSGLAGAADVSSAPRAAAVETLFDEGAKLIRPDVWLMGWKLAALENPDSQSARFFHAILATLCAVLPDVKEIHVSREAVEVEGPSIGRVPLGALSDGYRTTVGWILDMIARWVEEAKRGNIPIDGDFHEKMTGVVLVDEIDLHLHPRWQRNVISMVRGHFPRMSFVVTTHNPLTLLGALPGEIYVLTRTEQGDVTVEQRDLPPGIDAEQVLTGDWFGLASTLDDATLDKLAEHQRLILEKGLDAPEAVEKEEELRRLLGSYASTSIERLAQAAAAQVIDKDVRTLTPKERRDAQEQIEELLREDLPGSSKARPPKRAAIRGLSPPVVATTRMADNALSKRAHPKKLAPAKRRTKAPRTGRSAR